MTDGDDETPADDAAEASADAEEGTDETGEVQLTAASIRERFESQLEDAETEAELDEVEAALDDVAAALADAEELPEPEEDTEAETEEELREELDGLLSDLREELEAERGPYAEDVIEDLEAAETKLTDTQWTERGEGEIVEAVENFAEAVAEILPGEYAPAGADVDALTAALDDVEAAVEEADLDPDEDAETIASLLEATDGLESGLEDAQEWDDLEVREKLMAQGFYDCLGHYKDYPPEWSAIKEWEQRGNVEMILLAYDMMDSDFMEQHCIEALTRMGDAGAYDEMFQLASRRNRPGIKAIGKMGSDAEEAVETLIEYVDTDSDPQLQKVTFKALGEIGSEEATQAIADKLVMDNDNVRPYAARALGLIGDARAVDPLIDTVENDDSDTVRAAAAWALLQIGTERALEAVAEHADDRAYLLQQEGEKAAEWTAAKPA
ncbi:MAG: HEAT repeat domain-containing protein [Salinigranum sp.]